MLKRGLLIGGRYRLEAIVGQGAMATVWRAIDESLGRTVAIKLIQTDEALPKDATARFVREAQATAAVQHRFVIEVFDVGETEEGLPYMVMELLQGEPLADRISSGPRLPLKTFVDVMIGALAGLHAVHEAGVIHRDLKPENIFLVSDADGYIPKLVDFGISRVKGAPLGQSGVDRLTKEGTILGTPYYMSPEQVRGASDLDRRTDIYSAGVLMYEILCGEVPFQAEAVGEVLVMIATSDAIPPDVMRPDLDRGLVKIVERAMARDREERFRTALEMKRALQALPPEALRGFASVVDRPDRETFDELGSGELIPATGHTPPPRAAVDEDADTAPVRLPPSERREGAGPSPVLFLLLGALVVIVGVLVGIVYALPDVSAPTPSAPPGHSIANDPPAPEELTPGPRLRVKAVPRAPAPEPPAQPQEEEPREAPEPQAQRPRPRPRRSATPRHTEGRPRVFNDPGF